MEKSNNLFEVLVLRMLGLILDCVSHGGRDFDEAIDAVFVDCDQYIMGKKGER